MHSTQGGNLSREVAIWRTPATSDPGITPERLRTADGDQWQEGERAYDAETGRMCQTGLTQQAATWATPLASIRAQTPRKVDHGIQLANQVEQWMTPNVPNGGRTASHAIVKGRTLTREDGTKVQLGLEHQAKTWPTPMTRDHRSGHSQKSDDELWGKKGKPLERVATTHSSALAPTTPAGPTSSPERRTLNPLFVEWLMGWPIGWTGSAPVETASSHWWQAMRGELLRLGSRPSGQGTLV